MTHKKSTQPRKRRLPKPRMPDRPLQLSRYSPPPAANPYVTAIVQQISQVAVAAHLSLFSVLTDWTGMIEGSLRMWAANMQSMAIDGQFIDDPPDIAAIFRQARERYLRASARYPSVYRQMQQAFSTTFVLLLESASPGLAWYGRQQELHPDVIGQVLMTALQPGPSWGRYVPPWSAALTLAETILPEADELVYLELAQAARRARTADHDVTLRPGENFPDWLATIKPFYKPLTLSSPIDSSGMMLALAAQFSPWIVKRNLVRFEWPGEVDPLLRQMAAINANLYGLNGFVLAQVDALAAIALHLEQQPDAPPPSAHPTPPPPPEDSPPPTPPSPSFADLFKRSEKPAP